MTNEELFHLTGNISKSPIIATHAKGNYIYTEGGRKIFDASVGAAVAALGHSHPEVIKAMHRQGKKIHYVSATFTTPVTIEYSDRLLKTTHGKLTKVYFSNSGSDATEAAVKVAFSYSKKRGQDRSKVIFRSNSYHGNTLYCLSISGIESRKIAYTGVLSEMPIPNQVSSCYAYRQRSDGETDQDFVSKKAIELDMMFEKLGKNTVAAFIVEPIVGAALGCVPFVPGYLNAMKQICDKHGALLILDEIMCGMGRSGTFHAWEQETGFSPDIVTVGKGITSGAAPFSAVMVSSRVAETFKENPFSQGHTYDAYPPGAAAGLATLSVIQEKNLVTKVHELGKYLGNSLHGALGGHKYVGNIRGSGFFWGIEFVQDKFTKQPFSPCKEIAQKLQALGLSELYSMNFYISPAAVGKGDVIMVAPSFLCSKKDLDHITKTLSKLVPHFFSNV